MAEDMFTRQMKRRRAELGLSQADLAERVVRLGGSMYQQTIAKIESGSRAVRLSEADVIAKALETTVTRMLSSAIEGIDSDNPRISIFDLLSQAQAAERRCLETEEALAEATHREEEASVAATSAQYELMVARAEVSRLAARHEELRQELAYLSKMSMDKQMEFNRRIGPRWREALEKNPELEWETLPEPDEGPSENSRGG